MKCGRCGFFAECEESGRDPDVCDDYDETDEAMREEQPWEQGGVQESQVSILWNCGLWAHHGG